MMKTVTLSAVTLLVLAGCKEDVTTEKANWAAATEGWNTKLAAIKTAQAERLAKAKALATPEGDETLAAEKTALVQAVEAETAMISAVDAAIAGSKTSVDAALEAGKKMGVQSAIDGAGKAIEAALAEASKASAATAGSLADLEQKVATATASADKLKAEAAAFAAMVADAAKKKGASVDFSGIAFSNEALDLDKSKVALEGMSNLFKACPAMKGEISVVAMGEAADLGQKRAEALKNYLAGSGVDAKAIVKAKGSAAKEGADKVSVTVDTPCK